MCGSWWTNCVHPLLSDAPGTSIPPLGSTSLRKSSGTRETYKMHVNEPRSPARRDAEYDTSKNEASSPQLLMRAIDSLGEIVLVFTPGGKIVEWNSAVSETTGYTDEDIAGMRLTDFVPVKDAGFARRRFEEILEDGHAQFEIHFQTKEGLAAYQFTGSLLKQNGKPLLCAIGRKIGKRNVPNKEEETTETRFRRLFQDAQEGIAITTPEGTIIDANPAAKELLGYGPEDRPLLNVTDLYANPSEQKEIAAKLRRDGHVSGEEVRFCRSDGEEIVCEISVTARRGDKGAPREYYTFFRDVTGRKRAEKALAESEEKFRKLAEGALVGIALIQDGMYEYVNPALSSITGYSTAELLGTPVESVVHPKDWPHVQAQIEGRISGETDEAHYEARIQSKSGETRCVEVAGSRVTYRGEPAVIATIRDVTEHKQLQQEVLQVQEQERRRLGQDLHDGIASQLTGATLLLDTLSTKAEEASASSACAFGETEAERLQKSKRLVKESADEMRRLSRGLRPAGLPEGDLLSALDGLAQSFGSTCFEADSVDSVSLGEEEATQLYRIAQEAVNNARRHTEEAEIAIRVRREEGTLALEVEDQGDGFTPSTLERKKSLGLRSMQYRAETIGADLDVESAPGEGTLVRCHLPH